MNLRLLLAVLALVSHVAIAAPPKRLFETTLEDVQAGGRVLNVVFYTKVPAPAVVDKILRDSLDQAIRLDPSRDILGMAFFGNDALSSNQHSGSLVYKAAERKVVTLDEYQGVKTSTSATASYLVQIQEGKTLAGIKPERKWLSVTIVFSKPPTRDVAYDAIIAEAQKLAAKGLDINLFVSVGDPKVKTSWQQMRDKDGAYVFAEYTASTKGLARKGQVIKQFP